MEEKKNYISQLEKFGVISFVPKGNSMYPTLKNKGQSVCIKKKEKRLEKFDVGFYLRENGTFVLHRVLEVLEDGYVMCGDSQFYLEKIGEDKVFGYLTHYYKGKNLVEVDGEHKKKIAKFYKRKTRRKIRVKSYLFLQRVKNKLKRIFKRK